MTQFETAIQEKPETEPAWPREVAVILTALEAAGWTGERRTRDRIRYRVQATLRLFTDGHAAEVRKIYTRDAGPRSIGFVTPHRLPLGYGGTLQIPSPETRRLLTIRCTVLRCRLAAPGWYEGALYFNRDRAEFSPKEIEG